MQAAHHRSRFGAFLTAVALVFLVAPIVIVVLFSFQNSGSLSFPITGLSLRWYREVFSAQDVASSVKYSLIVAAVVAASTLVLGTMAAYGLTKLPAQRRWIFVLLFFVPITLPGLFMGVGLLVWFLKLGFELNLRTVVIAHLVYVFPYFFLIAQFALERLDPALEEAAATLGASPFTSFRRVTLPQILPVLAGATGLAFMLSFDEFIITNFVTGNQSTLPLLIASRLRRTVDPTLNVISTLLVAGSLVIWALAFVAVLRKERQRRQRQAVAAPQAI